MNSKKALLIAAIALAGGSIPPFAKLSLEVVEPFTLVFMRFTAASLVISFFLPKKELSFDYLKKLKWVAIIGALNPIFIFLSLEHLPSNMTALFYSIVPGLGVAYLFFVKHEKVSRLQLSGFAIGLLGVIAISQESVANDGEGNALLGLGLAAVAVFAFFTYGILSKESQRNTKISGVALAFYFSVATAVISLPIAVYETVSESWIQAVELKHVLAIVYLGFIGTGAQYLLFQKALKTMEVAHANLFLYLQPAIGAVLAFLLVDETVSPQLAIGGLIVLIGARLALSERQDEKP